MNLGFGIRESVFGEQFNNLNDYLGHTQRSYNTLLFYQIT